MSSRRQRSIPLGGRYRQVSLYMKYQWYRLQRPTYRLYMLLCMKLCWSGITGCHCFPYQGIAGFWKPPGASFPTNIATADGQMVNYMPIWCYRSFPASLGYAVINIPCSNNYQFIIFWHVFLLAGTTNTRAPLESVSLLAGILKHIWPINANNRITT